MLSVSSSIASKKSDRCASFASVHADEEIVKRVTGKVLADFDSPSAGPATHPALAVEAQILEEKESQHTTDSKGPEDTKSVSNKMLTSKNSFENTDVSKVPVFKPKTSNAVSSFLTNDQVRQWWATQCEQRPEFRNEDVFNKFGGQYAHGTVLRHVEQADLRCRIVGSKFSEKASRNGIDVVYVLELCRDVTNGKKLEAGVVEVHQHWDWLLVEGSKPAVHKDDLVDHGSVPSTMALSSTDTIMSLLNPVIPCMRGGRTLILSMDPYSWTENFYINPAWERWSQIAFVDRHAWNSDWVMAGENALLEYELVILDDKFLECEWDTFSPAFKTYFLGGGGIVLLGHNNRPNLIPKLNELIGCKWQWEGLQRPDHDMSFEITPRCRQLYERNDGSGPLGTSVPTRQMNFITVPARERLLKALPEDDLCEDENLPEEERFHNLPEEYTPCAVHYGQLSEGAQRPGMVAWFGCSGSDEHEFWPLLFREIVAQRIEKQKKRRRRQKKNKKGGEVEDGEEQRDGSESNFGGSNESKKGKGEANRSNSREDSNTNLDFDSISCKNMNNEYYASSTMSSPSFYTNNRNPSKNSSADSVGYAGGSHGGVEDYYAYKGNWVEKHGSIIPPSKHTTHIPMPKFSPPPPSPYQQQYWGEGAGAYYPPSTSHSTPSTHPSSTPAHPPSSEVEAERKRRTYLEQLNYGILRNFDPTKHRVVNKIVMCREHYAYVNELPNGQIVQYQQAGATSFFFIGDEIFHKTKGTRDWLWFSSKILATYDPRPTVAPPSPVDWNAGLAYAKHY